jgi:hypothetical protein
MSPSTSSTTGISTGVPETTAAGTGVGGTTSTTRPAIATTTTTTTVPAAGNNTASDSGTDGGLSIELTATPSRGSIDTPVVFTLQATEANAPGALHYLITYGDGSQASNVTDDLCTAGPGAPASQTWTLSHQYATAGTYTVTATVGVNCSKDSATATVSVAPIDS